MTDEAYGARLVQRLEQAADRNRIVLENNRRIKAKLDKALPILTKNLKGNEVVLAAMREVYSALEKDGEELQSTIVELKLARDSLDIAASMLEQAGFDFANIQSFSKDEIWIAEHSPTIKRALETFNLDKLKVELDSIERNRRQDLRTIFIEAHD